MGWGYVPSVNHLLFLMNVCTAFDSKIFWARSFWESPSKKVLISLRKLWWCKKLNGTVLCSMCKRQFKRKWETSSLINLQSHLEFVIILDRNRSYLSDVILHIKYWVFYPQLSHDRNFSQYNFTCRLILNVSNVLVFSLVSDVLVFSLVSNVLIFSLVSNVLVFSLVSLSRIGILFCQIIWLFWLSANPW